MVAIAKRPFNINTEAKAIAEGKVMNESTDQSRRIEITGGNVNASGAGALSLGDISGTVANTINQLPLSSKPGQPELKEQLEQLKAAIESEPSLSDQDKADALKLVEDLAVAGKAPQESGKQQVAKTAIRTLKGIISDLPDIAKLAEAGKTLLPMIAHLFGL